MGRFGVKASRLIGLLAILAMLVPMFNLQASSAQDTGKILRVHQVTDPDVVDPQKSSFTNEIAILALNYEGLTRLDSDGNTVPAAAESWEFNADGTVLTFHLRAGLTYSDGSPLTAERFRYAVERTCDPNTAGEYQSILFEIKGCAEFAGSLTAPEVGEGTPPAEVDPAAYETTKAALGVKAIDDVTLELTLTNPAPYYPTIAGLWVFFPAKQELIEQGGDAWWKDPALQLGNGPFQITKWEDEQLVGFTANEHYWGGRAKLDGIEYIYQGDSAVALEAYRNGDLDIMQVDSVQIPEVQADATLAAQMLSYTVASTYTLNFNLAQAPFDDIKVRQAFSQAFDRETYCAVVRNGDCSPTLSWIPPGLPGSIETDLYGFDPDAAKAALAESSYGSADKLPEIKLFYNADDPANTTRAEWVAGQYRDILGVNITLQPTEGTALVALRKDPATFPQMLLVGGWIQDYPDPQNWLSVYFKCDATFAKRFNYCNPEFDKLVGQADVEFDATKRMELYQQAGQILVNDIPSPFLYNLSNVVLINPKVTGYTPAAVDAEWPGQFASLLTIDISE
ncbi:MAG TPA: peptide ABC transporter substrate-binding protein [Thermomicrobiales bacterium]|nr:peptide ABC transporter substrate-binding protein [Thermomicrobiales bacterium]